MAAARIAAMDARNAAINADAYLKAAFRDIRDAGIRAALRKSRET